MNKDIKVSVFFLEITQQILDSSTPSNVKAIKENCLSIDGKVVAPYLIDTKKLSDEEIGLLNPGLLISINPDSLDHNSYRRIVLFPDNNQQGMQTIKYLLHRKMLKEGEPIIIGENGDLLLHNETDIKLSTEEAFKNDMIVSFLRNKEEERKSEEINDLLAGTGVVLPE